MRRKSLPNLICSFATILALPCALGVVISIFAVDGFSSQNHEQNRTIEQAYSSNPQVRVTQLRVGQQLRRFAEGFNESEDWLRRLSLQLENISEKPIVYVRGNINFPETRSSGSLMSFPIEFSQKPGTRFQTNNLPLRLMPGETLEVSLDPHYHRLRRFLETRHPIATVHRAQVEIGFIVFEDRTAWSAGHFYRQNPDNPDRYINVGTSPIN